MTTYLFLILILTLSTTFFTSRSTICTEEFLLQRNLNNNKETCNVIHEEIGDIHGLFLTYQSTLRQLLSSDHHELLKGSETDKEVYDLIQKDISYVDNLVREIKASTLDRHNSVVPHLEIFPVDNITIVIYKDGNVFFSGPITKTPTLPSDRKWFFLFHGMGYPDQLDKVKDRLLSEKAYIVVPDYSVGTNPLIFYPFSVYGSMTLIQHLRSYVWDVLQPLPEATIFIGHSYGGQIGGVLAREVNPGHFIALDPAGPLYDYLKIPSLDIYSGKRSITIHTSAPWGSMRSKSTTDIFVNDRRKRYKECNDKAMFCNHMSSIILFLEFLDTEFVLFNNDIFYTRLTKYFNIRPGVYNTQSHLGVKNNTREPIYVSSSKE